MTDWTPELLELRTRAYTEAEGDPDWQAALEVIAASDDPAASWRRIYVGGRIAQEVQWSAMMGWPWPEEALESCPECGHATAHHDEDGCKVCDCKWTPKGAGS